MLQNGIILVLLACLIFGVSSNVTPLHISRQLWHLPQINRNNDQNMSLVGQTCWVVGGVGVVGRGIARAFLQGAFRGAQNVLGAPAMRMSAKESLQTLLEPETLPNYFTLHLSLLYVSWCDCHCEQPQS